MSLQTNANICINNYSMNPQGKYNLTSIEKMKRDSPEWQEFVNWQEKRIRARLSRYNSIRIAKEQLDERKDLTPYQRYKIESVSKFLVEAIERIKNGSYGYCKYCGIEITVARLFLVPAALQCIDCGNNKRLNT